MATVEWHDEAFRAGVEAKVRAKLAQAGELVGNNARALMREPKTGTDVPAGRRVPGWVTRRSAPGEAPAVQTARLAGSATVAGKIPSADEGGIGWEQHTEGLGVRIGTSVPYGLYLELGTRGRMYTPKNPRKKNSQLAFGTIPPMAARPWLRPALARAMPVIRRMFGND